MLKKISNYIKVKFLKKTQKQYMLDTTKEHEIK